MIGRRDVTDRKRDFADWYVEKEKYYQTGNETVTVEEVHQTKQCHVGKRTEGNRKQFPPGTPMKVEVLEVTDNGRKIRLSRKAAQEAQERAEFEGYVQQDAKDSSSGFGTLGDVLKKKIK